MRTIKLYGTGSATANAVAQVTIPNRSRLVGIQYAIAVDQVADNSSMALEISKASATELAVNGAQQSVAVVRQWSNSTTPSSTLNGFLPVDVQLEQGQILYLHAVITTTTYIGEFVLHLV